MTIREARLLSDLLPNLGVDEGEGQVMLVKIIGAMVIIAGVSITPAAQASPVCVGVLNQSGCQPAPWNGQLMETWNTPGYYGGWTNGPVMCDPFTRQCRGWAQP